MIHCLEQIQDWPALARSVHYRVTELAFKWQVSPRKLERDFQAKLGCTPYEWLRRLRMERALQLIAARRPIKEIAGELCYDGKYPEHFTRDFKGYFGIPPTEYNLAMSSPARLRLQVLSIFMGLLQFVAEAGCELEAFPVS